MLTATVDASALHLSHYERTAYADRIKLTPASHKGVLMQLVLRQGSHRESWASIGFMAERVGCARSTARQALRVLERLGLVITTPGDNCETSGYRIDDQQLIAAGGGGGLVGRPARVEPVPPPPETGAPPAGNRCPPRRKPVPNADRQCREVNEEALPDWIIVARRAAYGVLGPAGLQLDADLIRAGDLVRACECLAIARYRANESPIGYFKKAVRERYRANKRERAFSAQLVRACYISQNPLASDSRGVPATGGVSERTDNGVVKETNHGTARDQDEAARGDTRLGGLHKHRGREVQTHDAEGRGEAAPSDQTQIAPGRHTTGFVRQRHSSRRYTLAADVRRPPPHTSAGGVSSF